MQALEPELGSADKSGNENKIRLRGKAPEAFLGEKLVCLSVSGLVNALAAVSGGVVDDKGVAVSINGDAIILQDCGIAIGELKEIATDVYQQIHVRLQLDELNEIPNRIQEFLFG